MGKPAGVAVREFRYKGAAFLGVVFARLGGIATNFDLHANCYRLDRDHAKF